MEKVKKVGLMVQYTKESGLKEKSMAKEHKFGLTIHHIQVISNMIIMMVLAFLSLLMAESMKEPGLET